jgi:hypothetical protein
MSLCLSASVAMAVVKRIWEFSPIFRTLALFRSVKAKCTNLSIAEGLAVDPTTRTIYTGEVRPDKIGDMPTGSTVRNLVKQ